MTLSMNATPAVTVLMACFNAARWLDESISSVLNQTFGDFEFIIVDDGSLDNTLDLIKRYAASDQRIVVVSKPNSGPGDSRNIGIQMARGEWIAVIDADDVCEPTRLEKQICHASKNSALVFIGTGLTIIDDAGNKLNVHSYPASHTGLVQHLRTARKFPPHSSAFYRTQVVRALGGFRLSIHRAEDWDLWLRLSEVGELSCLSEPLVQIRKHLGQISHSENGRRQIIDSRLATVSYWLRHFKVSDPVDSDETSFNNFSEWIQSRLQKNGLFEFQEFKVHLLSVVGGASRSPLGVVRLFAVCICKPFFTLRFIHERIFGESLTRRLALEWIKQQKFVKS